MKPTPLKGKGVIGDCVCGDETDRDATKWFPKSEIKSAVEWILQRKLGKKLIAVNLLGEEMLVFYKKDFEEAFDVKEDN